MQIAVGAHIGIWIFGIAGRGGRVIRAVGFKLAVTPASGSGVIGPVLWIGSARRSRAVELIAPDERFFRDAAAGITAGCRRSGGASAGGQQNEKGNAAESMNRSFSEAIANAGFSRNMAVWSLGGSENRLRCSVYRIRGIQLHLGLEEGFAATEGVGGIRRFYAARSMVWSSQDEDGGGAMDGEVEVGGIVAASGCPGGCRCSGRGRRAGGGSRGRARGRRR